MAPSVARQVDEAEASCLTIGQSTSMTMAVVRLRPASNPFAPVTSAQRDAAFAVCLQLNPIGEDVVSVIDLRKEPTHLPAGALDCLIFFITQSSIDDVSRERAGQPIADARWPRDVDDSILATLGRLLLPALEGRADPNSPVVQHVGHAIRLHLASAYIVDAPRPVAKGGLAAWQERRAKECMRQNYAASLSIPDIARECGLSPSHFTRAFRQSTGMQPHRWLTQHRIETAKAKLVEGDMSLAEISLACGFGDQSNFTRVFSTIVGVSPGNWQRINR